MKMFDKKLQKLNKEMQRAAKQEEMKSVTFEVGGVDHVKPGVPMPVIHHKSPDTLDKSQHKIATHYARVSEKDVNDRDDNRIRINNLLRHKRAISIIQDV
jgi:hypothetical protein